MVDPSVVGPRAALQRHLPRTGRATVTVGLDTPTRNLSTTMGHSTGLIRERLCGEGRDGRIDEDGLRERFGLRHTSDEAFGMSGPCFAEHGPSAEQRTISPVRGVCIVLLLEGLADDLRFVVRSDLAGSSPERGRSSSSSSTPPASYRSSHCVTVGLDTPTPPGRSPTPTVPRQSRERCWPFRPRVAVWSVCSPIAPSACVLLGATESYALEVPCEESTACIYYSFRIRFLLHYTSTSSTSSAPPGIQKAVEEVRRVAQQPSTTCDAPPLPSRFHRPRARAHSPPRRKFHQLCGVSSL